MDARMRAVRAVIERYVEATRGCDAAAMRAVFHPAAAMNGWLGPQALVGSPEPFYGALEAAGGPMPGYEAEIGEVRVEGGTAVVTLRERNCLGVGFVNHFHLMEEGGEWRIVAKLFQTI